MQHIEKYKQEILAEIERSEESLKPLKEGIRIGRRTSENMEWVDVTDEWIKQHESTIGLYKNILSALERS